jgi:E3 ubiquitin-protein ligase HERC2
LPKLVEEFKSVRSIAASAYRNLDVTKSGIVFRWGSAAPYEVQSGRRPIIVEGFGRVRLRQVFAGLDEAFAITDDRELFSWGLGSRRIPGTGNAHDQPLPKLVDALRGVRVSSVSVGRGHALALVEDGLVYVWGNDRSKSFLGLSCLREKLLPKPVEALRGVRVGNIGAAGWRSYAVADTGEVWGWGVERNDAPPVGHNGLTYWHRPPEPIESLRGINVDAVAAGRDHTLALADAGSVYAWGGTHPARSGALGLGLLTNKGAKAVRTPRCVLAPLWLAACEL